MIEVRHEFLQLPDKYRCIVISDIHSHCTRFKQLLEKINFSDDDYLIINGDFVEKGTETIQTIKYIQYLQTHYKHVYVVLGNCEYALETLINDERFANQLVFYFNKIGKSGLIDQAVNALNIDINCKDYINIQKQVRDFSKPYLEYIQTLPTSLEMNDFLIVHSGIENRIDWKNSERSSFIENRTFQSNGHQLDKYVIVGHLPTSNFYIDKICNEILIDDDKKIISIDGGTGVKFISQLNALIIEKDKDLTFKKEYIQPLDTYTCIKDYHPDIQPVHKIAWPDFEVELLEKHDQFSKCRQINTNKILDIKNEFLYQKDDKLLCLDDYISKHIDVSVGDVVSLIGIYDQYAYIIKDRDIGWIKLECIKDI